MMNSVFGLLCIFGRLPCLVALEASALLVEVLLFRTNGADDRRSLRSLNDCRDCARARLLVMTDLVANRAGHIIGFMWDL